MSSTAFTLLKEMNERSLNFGYNYILTYDRLFPDGENPEEFWVVYCINSAYFEPQQHWTGKTALEAVKLAYDSGEWYTIEYPAVP